MASYRPILIGWLCLCGASPVLARSDSPGPLQTGSGAERSVRRTTLDDEIASVEAQLGSTESTATGDAVLVSKLETLRQIDFVLSLQQLTQDESETLNGELQGASEKLKRLQTAGLEEPTPVAIRILDAANNALESALARAQSLRLEIAAADSKRISGYA
jgi:hypothetical protein